MVNWHATVSSGSQSKLTWDYTHFNRLMCTWQTGRTGPLNRRCGASASRPYAKPPYGLRLFGPEGPRKLGAELDNVKLWAERINGCIYTHSNSVQLFKCEYIY